MMRNRPMVAEESARSWWKRLGLKLGLWLALGVALFLLVDRVLMLRLARHGEERACPGVLGLPLDQAEAALRRAGFEPVVEARRPDPAGRVEAGAVMDQQPRPGRVTKAGRRVHLTISAGVGQSLVPDLRGRSLRQALGLLAEARLEADTLNLGWRHDDRMGEGSVLSQIPAAGDSLPPGARVNLVLSLGPAPDWISTPALTGLTLAQARRRLERAGLEALVLDRSAGDKELVESQEPSPGTPLVPGSAVDLHVMERSQP